ncbi:MAG TPA: prephenate dehydratase [Acidimicrobiales bacterium]|jgi:prephenate dehydratase|nr:prephenate dehydratase [Acidimicrobiales bacterium]
MASPPRVAFLGPHGTFTEEALLAEPDLAEAELVAMKSMPEVLAAANSGDVDMGFVALENSIEGSVLLVLDRLVFDYELLIQREAVLTVHENLMAPPGMALADVKRVVSFPDAMAQCRRYFAESLPDAEIVAANSTAGAVRDVAENRPPGTAAVGAALAAKLYGLEVLAADIEDTPGANQTRFVVVGRSGIPAPTGHDKTSIVCFQRADRPGSLHAILGQFTARNINLTKLESRPTKHSLGDYCFIIDLEGHVDDEVVADCLRDLRVQLAGVKFLGSYPAAGEHGPAIRRDAEEAWRAADEWISSLRAQVAR